MGRFEKIVFCSVFLIQMQSPFCSSAPTIQFACCNFSNNFYDLLQQKNIYDVVFGEEVKPAALLRDQSLKVIENIISDLIESPMGVRYDNVEPLLDFFLFYKTHRLKATTLEDFLKIFNEYHPRTTRLGSMQQALKAINKLLVVKSKRAKNSVFIATVWPFIDTETVNSIKELKIFPLHFHHGAIVPVLNIQYWDQTGYLFLDTDFGIGEPMIVMENGASAPPQKFEIIQTPQEKYILVNNNGDKHLIYVRRPFCSFIKTTAKVRLLKTHRSIIRRDRTGKVLAKLSFKLHEGPPFFYFEYLNSSSNNLESLPIALNQLATVHNEPFYEEFVSQLNTDKGTMARTLDTILKMYMHETFLSFRQNMVENFNREQWNRLKETVKNTSKQNPQSKEPGPSKRLNPLGDEMTAIFLSKVYPASKRKATAEIQKKSVQDYCSQDESRNLESNVSANKKRHVVQIYQRETGPSNQEPMQGGRGQSISGLYGQTMINNPLRQEIYQGYGGDAISLNQDQNITYNLLDRFHQRGPNPYSTQHLGQSDQSSSSIGFNLAQQRPTNPISRPSLTRYTPDPPQWLSLNIQDNRERKSPSKGKSRSADS